MFAGFVGNVTGCPSPQVATPVQQLAEAAKSLPPWSRPLFLTLLLNLRAELREVGSAIEARAGARGAGAS